MSRRSQQILRVFKEDILPIHTGHDGEYLSTDGETPEWIPIGPHTHDGETLQIDGINSDGGAFAFNTTGVLTFSNQINIGTLNAGVADYDKFLVSDGGLIKFRTGAQVLSDIAAAAAVHTHDGDTLQLDGVNSDGGAFPFTTRGDITIVHDLIIDLAAGDAEVTFKRAGAFKGRLYYTHANTRMQLTGPDGVASFYISNAGAIKASSNGGQDITLDSIASINLEAAGGVVNSDTDIVLADGAVFTSHDSDDTHYLSKVVLGWAGAGNDASFQHRALALDGTNYALKQLNLGNTHLNCSDGKNIFFKRNNVTITNLDELDDLTDGGETVLHSHSTAGSVLEAAFDADTFLYATLDNTPVATSPANVLAALSGHAAAAFDLNGQNLNNVGNLDVDGSAVFNEAGADKDYRFEGTGDVNLFKIDAGWNTVGAGVVYDAFKIGGVAPDAQSAIVGGMMGRTYADAVTNYGFLGYALGGGGTNNIGVFASVANATNNYPFKDLYGNYSNGGGWVDVSDREMKSLIRPMWDSEKDTIYNELDSLNVQAYVYKHEIPIVGYEKELRQETIDGTPLFEMEPGKPIYSKGRKVGYEPDKKVPVMEKVPIYDKPEKAPQRYGLLADEVPDHMASKDRKGIAAGRVAAGLVVICQRQKELIASLDNRVKVLEEAA